MIVELIVKAFAALATGIGALLGDADAPGFIANLEGWWSSFMGMLGGLTPWIPWDTAGAVVAAVLLAIGASFVVKVVRIVLSLFTGGGGSAA